MSSVIYSINLSDCTFNNYDLNASSMTVTPLFHDQKRTLTAASLSSESSISLLAVASSLGGFTSKL